MSPPTILCVDDEPIFRRVLSHLLRREFGGTVRTVASGEEALRYVADAPAPDLFIVDGMLPGMDGLALCRAIRQDEHLVHVPVVILTGRACSMRDDAIKAGATACVAKQSPQDALLITLHDILSVGHRHVHESDASEDLQVVRDEYDLTLAASASRVRQLIDAIADGDDAAVTELRGRAHRLAGTAGTFGLRDIAQCADHLERLLRDSNSAVDLSQIGARLVSLLCDRRPAASPCTPKDYATP